MNLRFRYLGGHQESCLKQKQCYYEESKFLIIGSDSSGLECDPCTPVNQEKLNISNCFQPQKILFYPQGGPKIKSQLCEHHVVSKCLAATSVIWNI